MDNTDWESPSSINLLFVYVPNSNSVTHTWREATEVADNVASLVDNSWCTNKPVKFRDASFAFASTVHIYIHIHVQLDTVSSVILKREYPKKSLCVSKSGRHISLFELPPTLSPDVYEILSCKSRLAFKLANLEGGGEAASSRDALQATSGAPRACSQPTSDTFFVITTCLPT